MYGQLRNILFGLQARKWRKCALVLVLLKLAHGIFAVREKLGKADGGWLGLLDLFLLTLFLFLLFLALA